MTWADVDEYRPVDQRLDFAMSKNIVIFLRLLPSVAAVLTILRLKFYFEMEFARRAFLRE